MERYGELERVRAVPGAKVLPASLDPRGRFVGAIRGRRLTVLDLEHEATTVATFDDVPPEVRVAPSGRRIVVRIGDRLELRDEAGYVGAPTPTKRIHFRGGPLPPGAPARDAADEHFGVMPDGRSIWLAAHDESGRACLFLYDERLALVDRHEALRSYSSYAEKPFERIDVFSESWLRPQPNGWILGARNAGDSCFGVLAFRAEGAKLVVEEEALQHAVFRVTGAFLRDLQITPRGELLVLDRDSLFSVLPWPRAPRCASATSRRRSTSATPSTRSASRSRARATSRSWATSPSPRSTCSSASSPRRRPSRSSRSIPRRSRRSAS